MRQRTVFAVGLMTCVALCAAPSMSRALPAPARAAEPSQKGKDKTGAAEATEVEPAKKALAAKVKNLSFDAVPFEEAVAKLGEVCGTNLFLDRDMFVLEGFKLDAPVTIRAAAAGQTVESVLKRIVAQSGNKGAGYDARGDVVVITSKSQIKFDREVLDREIPTIKIEGVTLSDALDFLTKDLIGGRKLKVDWDALAAAGVTRDTRIDLNLDKKVTVQRILREMLDAADKGKRLEFFVTRKEVIVTTREKLKDALAASR